MTVSELIDELKTMPPNMQVKTYTATIYMPKNEPWNEGDYDEVELSEHDATPVDLVRNCAAYCLIVGQ